MVTRALYVSLAGQCLWLHIDGEPVARYPVSTAANGPGERNGSGCTPRGRHRIHSKIGIGRPLGAVFVGRRPTGEIYSPALAAHFPERDWILTRILWLEGLQAGFNRGDDCDTMSRYIYIHGCPDGLPLGVALSHGCIRMANTDVAKLFARVAIGDRVTIGD